MKHGKNGKINSMEKEFVPYELALRMKALRFDEPCLGYYAADILCTGQPREIQLDEDGNYKKSKTESFPIIVAPTYSQAFRWFREKYKLNQLVTRLPKHYVGVIDSEDGIIQLFYQRHDTYEEAEAACLKKLIEIVEQKEKV